MVDGAGQAEVGCRRVGRLETERRLQEVLHGSDTPKNIRPMPTPAANSMANQAERE